MQIKEFHRRVDHVNDMVVLCCVFSVSTRGIFFTGGSFFFVGVLSCTPHFASFDYALSSLGGFIEELQGLDVANYSCKMVFGKATMIEVQ